MTPRLGLGLSDCSDGVLFREVRDFVTIEGPAIHQGDTILKINGFSAKNQWRDLLKGGAPNSPFRLQFLSQASGEVSSCVIYKQMIDPVPDENADLLQRLSKCLEDDDDDVWT